MEQAHINLRKHLDEEDRERIRDISQNLNSFDKAIKEILKTGIENSIEETETKPMNRVEIDERVKKSLKDDQQLLLKIIKSEGETSARKLYRIYREETRWPSPQKTLRKHLKEMEEKELIQNKGGSNKSIYLAV